MTSRHRLPEVPAQARRAGALAVVVLVAVVGFGAGAHGRRSHPAGTPTASTSRDARTSRSARARARTAWAARSSPAPTTRPPPPGTRRASATSARRSSRSWASTTSFDTQRPSAEDLAVQENDSFVGQRDRLRRVHVAGRRSARSAGGSGELPARDLVRRRAPDRPIRHAEAAGRRRRRGAGLAAAAAAPTKPVLKQHTDGSSDGGFDVVAFGTGLRLSRRLRAGLTVNRWTNGYDAEPPAAIRGGPDPDGRVREFGLDFRPSGWSFNFGVIVLAGRAAEHRAPSTRRPPARTSASTSRGATTGGRRESSRR